MDAVKRHPSSAERLAPIPGVESCVAEPVAAAVSAEVIDVLPEVVTAAGFATTAKAIRGSWATTNPSLVRLSRSSPPSMRLSAERQFDACNPEKGLLPARWSAASTKRSEASVRYDRAVLQVPLR
jgi:hypothetical protein